MADVTVRIEPNAAETLRQAGIAEASAAVALAAAGPNYADTAAGLAATNEGDTFAVEDGGIVTVYRHDAGPTATELRVLPTAALLASIQDALNLVLPDAVATVPQRTVRPWVAALIPSLKIHGVFGAGIGTVEHNFDARFEFDYQFGNITATEGEDLTDIWFDWESGDDTTGNGQQRNPYKTLAKAAEGSPGTIWMKSDSNEILDIDGALATYGGGTGGRALRVKQFNPAEPKRFIAPGTQAADATWTETTAGSKIWKFTPADAAGQVERILYIGDGEVIGARIIPHRGDATDTADAIAKLGSSPTDISGWTQVAGLTGDVFLRFGDRDISADKAKFFIVYGATPHRLRGCPIYMEDMIFIGGGGIRAEVSPTVGTLHGRVFLKGGGSYYALGDTTGGGALAPKGSSYIIAQDFTERYCSQDGCGPYGSSKVFFADCDLSFNGWPGSRQFSLDTSRNRQGISTHETSQAAAIGCTVRYNYGQNVANTTSNDATETTWFVGCDFSNPGWAPELGSTPTPYTAVETYGVAYLDSCKAGGRNATHGLVVGSGTAHVYRNMLDGQTAAAAGTRQLYDPFA